MKIVFIHHLHLILLYLTGDTIPNRKLGPTRDHTTNSSSGGFVYWNQQLPYTDNRFLV